MGYSKQLLNHPELVKTVESNTMPRPGGLARLTTDERVKAGGVAIVRRETVPQWRGDSYTYEIQLSEAHNPYGEQAYIELPCCLGGADEPLAEAALVILVRYYDVDMRSLGLTALRTASPPTGGTRRRYIVWPTFWPDYDTVVQQARGLLAMAAFTPEQPSQAIPDFAVDANGDLVTL